MAGFPLYLWGVGRFYRIRYPAARRLEVRCPDGGKLCIYHRPARYRRYLEPVVLCHGIATNHLNMDFEPPYSLAVALADAGFECFSVDWRGSGLSRPPPGKARYDVQVDDLIRMDAPTLVDCALLHAQSPKAFWLGHSMGALVGYAAAQEGLEVKLKGLLAMGAPVFFEFKPWLQSSVRLGTWLSFPWAFRQRLFARALAPFLGYVTLPLSDTIVNPKAILPAVQRKVYANIIESVGRRLLRQFSDWISHDAFVSADGKTDYRKGLSRLTLPALVMGGSADRLATARSVRAQFDLLASTDKTLMLFGVENGDGLDYGHGDLIFGALAPKEIHPRIIHWLTARATPLPP